VIKKVEKIIRSNLRTILAGILLAASISICAILFSLQMYLDSFVFFMFGLGMYWYIRLVREEKKGGIWYEMDIDDVEVG